VAQDEAVLRIVLDEGGAAPAPATSPPNTTSPQPPPRLQPASPPTPQNQAAPPAPQVNPASRPIPVTVVKPPNPALQPPPAAPSTPPASQRDWMRDLVEGIPGANRHVLMEGGTGSGKSSAARNVAFERAKKGEEVNVLDPHKPETWKGVSKVFTRESAEDFAKLMMSTLRGREKQSVEGRAKGEDVDFKPVTFALSDFAAVMKDFPELRRAVQTVLTEGRKFIIAVLAETAGFNAQQAGPGTAAMRQSFGQKVQMRAPGPDEPDRTARIGRDVFKVPDLSAAADTNKGRYDPSIVQYENTQPPEPEPEPPFDPVEVAKKRVEAEERRAAVDAEYAKLRPQPLPTPFDPVEVAKKRVEREKQQAAADAEYRKLVPQRGKSAFDSVLEVAESMRGVVGGVFGKVVGVALDLTAKLRSVKAAVPTTAPEPGLPGPTAADYKPPVATALPAPPVPVAAALPAPPEAKPAAPVFANFPSPKAEPIPQAVPIPEAEPVKQAPAPADVPTGGGTGGIGALGAVGAVVGAVVAVAAVIGELSKSINSMADKYTEYNPEIAQAQAMAEIRGMMGDMRRAQESGPELVQFIQAQSEMQQKWEDFKMQLMKQIMPILTAILRAVSMILGIAEESKQGNFEDPTDLILRAGEVERARHGAEIPLSAPLDVIG